MDLWPREGQMTWWTKWHDAPPNKSTHKTYAVVSDHSFIKTRQTKRPNAYTLILKNMQEKWRNIIGSSISSIIGSSIGSFYL